MVPVYVLVAREIDRGVGKRHTAAALLPRKVALREVGVAEAEVAAAVDVRADAARLDANACGHLGDPVASDEIDGLLCGNKRREQREDKSAHEKVSSMLVAKAADHRILF